MAGSALIGEISFRDRSIRIKKDNSVSVSAHKQVPIKAIEAFILRKSDLIFSTFDKNIFLQSTIKKPMEFVSNEKLEFLGKQLELTVVAASYNQLVVENDCFYLFTKSPDNFKLKEKLVNGFFRDESAALFEEISKKVYPLFEKNVPSFPEIKLRKMISQWGNCRPSKMIITLNTKLIQAPISCIEYVIIHEFVHFIHPNHSKKFYSTLESFLPDWRQRKNMLAKYTIRKNQYPVL